MEVKLRPARTEEAAMLTELCLRSKVSWGYDAAFMAACVPSLRVQASAIAAGAIIVAAGADDRPLGLYGLSCDGRIADLEIFFVDPKAMGRGIGRRLFTHACARAKASGCRCVTILADPGAVPFYLKMGAYLTGTAPSDAIPDRSLPTLEVHL